VENNYLEEKDAIFHRHADSHTIHAVTPKDCNFLNDKVIENPSLEHFLRKFLSTLF
jgi:hypothetical protein